MHTPSVQERFTFRYILAAFFALTAHALAAQAPLSDTVLVDFGSIPSPRPWNNITNPMNGRSSELSNTRGWPTGILLSVTDSFASVNTEGPRTTGLAVDLPGTASSDSFFGNTRSANGPAQPSGGVTFTNLKRGKSYTVLLFASRAGATDNRETRFVLQGNTTQTLFLDAANNTDRVVSASLAPDASGSIRLTASPGPKNTNTNGFYYLNALKLIYAYEAPAGPAFLRLTSPNGGEFWQSGKTPSITWDCSPHLDKVNLEYSLDLGASWQSIATVQASARAFPWTIPNQPSEQCLVRISSSALSQSSERPFQISADTDSCVIAVIGSSTAEGSGASSPDSSWVGRFRTALFQKNTRYQVVNLARRGYTSFHALPTGIAANAGIYIPIDTARNITKALTFNPFAVIVNMPSNDAANNIPAGMQMDNFRLIARRAAEAGARVWVSTTQPRNFTDPAQIRLQAEVRDSILRFFGENVLDFWTVLADSTGWIQPALNSGDGIHVNNAGHQRLFERVLEKNIEADGCTDRAISEGRLKNLPPARLQVAFSPSDSTFTLEFEADTPGTIEIRLFDAQGNLYGMRTERFSRSGVHTLSWTLLDSSLPGKTLHAHVWIKSDSGVQGARIALARNE